MKFFITVILLTVISAVLPIENGYYWRDYEPRTIPSDAFIAGTDENGDNIYIGQTYVKEAGGGLVPVQINPKKPYIYAELYGPNRVDKYIKILCGNQEQFEWLPTILAALEYDVRGKFVVFGGHEEIWGNYLIGRVKIGREHRVGKIIVVDGNGKPSFYIINKENKRENVTTNFEFLVFKKSEQCIQIY